MANGVFEMSIVHHLCWSNLQTGKLFPELFSGKKILNVTTVKLFDKIKIQCFWGLLRD